MATSLPIVAIVGRANVGKSSLFNRLREERQAIVSERPGTTRDPVTGIVNHEGHDFWLVDTAGLKNADDEFEFTIQEQITQAADSADLLMVVVEAGAAISQEDRDVAKLALRAKKAVVLVVNKAERGSGVDPNEYRRLGIEEIFLTSATQGAGTDELLDALVKRLPKRTDKRDPKRLKLALLGRPNVGKSSLFNALAKKQQALVADVAGTTRDVNRVDIRFYDHDLELLDTAGIRRQGKIARGVEHFSVLRALAAIQEADVCLMLMDVNELNTKLDQRIAGLIKEAGRGLILVVSKWDSAEKDAYTRDDLAPKIAREFAFAPWAPLVFTSSVTGQNVTKLLELAMEIKERRQTEVPIKDLNKLLQKAIEHHPPAGLKNKQPKLRYAKQVATEPPVFRFFGHDTRFLHWSYKRFLERHLREDYDFVGTPIKLVFSDDRDGPA